MIQFKYFHANSGYVHRLSIDRSSQEYPFSEKLFLNLRDLSEGNTFIYAPLKSGNAVMMQSVGGSESNASHGVFCDVLRDYPSKYINKLDPQVDDPNNPPAQLPDAPLPRVAPYPPAVPGEPIFRNFIPKIVDALINGNDKKIVIVTENPEESARFMNAISAVLPKNYMARIGFAIGINNIQNNDIYIDTSDRSDSLSIRIWFPEARGFKFENYAVSYYVFDATTGRDNYSAPLGTAAQVLEFVNPSDSDVARTFIDQIAKAFKEDGAIDSEKLESRSANFLLGLKKDFPSAAKVLENSDINKINAETDEEERSDAIESLKTAVTVMMDGKNSKNITNEQFEKIVKICANYDALAVGLSEQIAGYLGNGMSVYQNLAPEICDSVYVILGKSKNTGKCLKTIFDNWWMYRSSDKDAPVIGKESFAFLTKFIDVTCAKNHDNSDEAKGLVRNILGIIPDMVDYFGRDFAFTLGDSIVGLFDVAFEYQKKSVGYLSLSILLAPAYMGDNSQYREFLVKNLEKRFDKTKLKTKDLFKIIVEIQNTLVSIAQEREANVNIPKIKDIEKFIVNTDSGKKWCRQIIGLEPGAKQPLSNSIDDLLDAYENLGTDSQDVYPEMRELVLEKLLDKKYVNDNVSSEETYYRYESIISKIQREDDAVRQAKEFLKELKEKIENVSGQGIFRKRDISERYKTYSHAEKKEILEAGAVLDDTVSLESIIKKSKGESSSNKKASKSKNKKTSVRVRKVSDEQVEDFADKLANRSEEIDDMQFRKLAEPMHDSATKQYSKKNQKASRIAALPVDSSIIWTAIFPIITFVILSLPALIISKTASISLFAALNKYCAAVILPIYCIGEAVAMFFVNKKVGTKVNNTAWTIATGILFVIPAIIFVMLLLALYYLSII